MVELDAYDLMQRALFIPNAYSVIFISKGMENATEKFNICLSLFFVCLFSAWNEMSTVRLWKNFRLDFPN